jgi:hypothetical protein
MSSETPPDVFDSIEDANIAALHNQHQQGRGPPPLNGSHGFNIEKPAPCKFAPCGGRSHPPNVCCICDAPSHRVNSCCYLLGIPTDRLARATAFQQTRTTGDPPFTRAQVAGIDAESNPLPVMPMLKKSLPTCGLSRHNFILAMIPPRTVLP